MNVSKPRFWFYSIFWWFYFSPCEGCMKDSLTAFQEGITPYINDIFKYDINMPDDYDDDDDEEDHRTCGKLFEPCRLESDCCPEFHCMMSTGEHIAYIGVVNQCLLKDKRKDSEPEYDNEFTATKKPDYLDPDYWDSDVKPSTEKDFENNYFDEVSTVLSIGSKETFSEHFLLPEVQDVNNKSYNEKSEFTNKTDNSTYKTFSNINNQSHTHEEEQYDFSGDASFTPVNDTSNELTLSTNTDYDDINYWDTGSDLKPATKRNFDNNSFDEVSTALTTDSNETLPENFLLPELQDVSNKSSDENLQNKTEPIQKIDKSTDTNFTNINNQTHTSQKEQYRSSNDTLITPNYYDYDKDYPTNSTEDYKMSNENITTSYESGKQLTNSNMDSKYIEEEYQNMKDAESEYKDMKNDDSEYKDMKNDDSDYKDLRNDNEYKDMQDDESEYQDMVASESKKSNDHDASFKDKMKKTSRVVKNMFEDVMDNVVDIVDQGRRAKRSVAVNVTEFIEFVNKTQLVLKNDLDLKIKSFPECLSILKVAVRELGSKLSELPQSFSEMERESYSAIRKVMFKIERAIMYKFEELREEEEAMQRAPPRPVLIHNTPQQTRIYLKMLKLNANMMLEECQKGVMRHLRKLKKQGKEVQWPV